MKNFLLPGMLLLALYGATQNVGIGTNAPHASAALEIKATNKGLLIPRTSTASRTAIVTPAKGLIVYDTTTNSFWFHNGGAWVNLSVAASGGTWALTGNAGTNPATNFIGTTDAQPLVIKVNDVRAGVIDYDLAKGNVALGYQSLIANITGFFNTATGYRSLYSNQTGGRNTANGLYALYANTFGDNNTASGTYALSANTTGANNVATGVNALGTNTEGNYNTANGTNTLLSNLNGSYNTASGFNALQQNADGFNNTATGAAALQNNTHGNSNTAHGMYGLYLNTTGNNNTANGFASLYSNTEGHDNTGTGFGTLNYNQAGNYNTAAGSYAMYKNGSGNNNIASGYQALYSNTTGSDNIAIGNFTLFENTLANNNTTVGSKALKNNAFFDDGIYGFYPSTSNTAIGNRAMTAHVYGDNNTAVGDYALSEGNNGEKNTAIGSGSMGYGTTGSSTGPVGNTAVGYLALAISSKVTSDINTGIGEYALFNNTSFSNTAAGVRSLYNNTLGQENVAIGVDAGYAQSLNKQCTFLGNRTDAVGGSFTNSTAVGFLAQVTASDQVRIGYTSVTSIGGYTGWSNLSDGRFKRNINTDVHGLDFILQLTPVSYTFDFHSLHKSLHLPDSTIAKMDYSGENIRHTGFVAQDVESVAEKIGFEFSGVDKPKNPTDYYGLRYAEFVVPLVKAVQEQQQQIELLKRQNESLLKEIQLIKEKLK
ncbi:MAG: tail fiber domain-containing protein [Chitinophagaceae bacterium]